MSTLLNPLKGKELKRVYSVAELFSMVWLVVFTGIALSYSFISENENLVLQPENAYLPPFVSVNHFLGTDQLGRDLFHYLMQACHTAWFLTFPPLIVATVLGLVLGSAAGYFGDQGIRVPMRQGLLYAIWIGLFLYFIPLFRWKGLSEVEEIYLAYYIGWAAYLGIGVLGLLVIHRLFLKKSSAYWLLPLDTAVQKAVEIWSTLPKLLLLLLLSTMAPPSLFTLMGWIAVSYWVLPARLSRNKVVEIKNRPFVEAALASGIGPINLFKRHIIPFLVTPLQTNFCFAASGLLGIGSTLAFIGIGLPPETPSWGKMLAFSRFSVEAWWLLVFPAAFLIGSILSLQVLGQKFSTSQAKHLL